jgi:predicted RNA-binding Zn-ribbon protein involved in translation (DUF1610 family)
MVAGFANRVICLTTERGMNVVPVGAQYRSQGVLVAMSEFITLSCPSCGGRLQITDSIERFACANCGNEHLVKRQGGMVFLAPVAETLQNIQTGTDNTASELAISRLKDEIKEIEAFIEKIKNAISIALSDPNKSKDVKKALASRRRSLFDGSAFEGSAGINFCVREIQRMSPEEFEQFKGNVTIKMIRTNLETIANCENVLQEKRNQLSKHQKIVSRY